MSLRGEELMITKKARFVIGIVTLSLVGVFVSSTGLRPARPRAARIASGQRQHGQATHSTGDWTLNKNLNDDSAKAMESMHSERRGESGHGPWMHGGGGRGGVDPGQLHAMQRAMEAPIDLRSPSGTARSPLPTATRRGHEAHADVFIGPGRQNTSTCW